MSPRSFLTRRARAAAATVALLLLLLPHAAVAHTQLDSSTPAAGSTATTRPDEVVLTFSKPIELLGDSVVVSSAGGRATVARSTVSARGQVVTATLADELASGTWEVRWRVLASDSHPREGEFTFTVDAPTTAEDDAESDALEEDLSRGAATGAREDVSSPSTERSDPVVGRVPFEVVGGAARIVFYLGLMVAAGLALFKAGPHRGEASRASRLAHVAAVAAGVALVASAAEVAAHVGALSDRGLAGLFDGGTWRAVLRTGLGTALALRSVGLVLLLAGAVRRLRRSLASGPDVSKLTGAAIAIASFQFVGHTASTAPEVVVRSADAVHAIAAAVWIGGLVGLWVISRHEGDRDAGARTAHRFSSIASGAVVTVGIAGIALAWANLPGPQALVGTGYGQLLLAKLGLVGGLAAIGAHNHFRVIPRIQAGELMALRQLKRAVRAEIAIVLVVVALTALLVNASPT